VGSVYLTLEKFDEARAHFTEALRLNDESGRRFGSHLLLSLGKVDFRQGNLDKAHDYFHASIRQATKLPDYNIIASTLGHAALALAQRGQHVEAATHAGASQAMYARQHRKPWEDSSLDTLLPDWRTWPDAAAICEALEAGLAFSNEQAVAYALGRG
jgi:tetratricopeptide (TPR) repeat protein